MTFELPFVRRTDFDRIRRENAELRKKLKEARSQFLKQAVYAEIIRQGSVAFATDIEILGVIHAPKSVR